MEEEFTGFLKFSAEWCQPCKKFAPILEEVKKQTGIECIEADIDSEVGEELSVKFGVRSVPTTIIFKKGDPVDVVVGVASKDKLLEMVSKVIEVEQ